MTAAPGTMRSALRHRGFRRLLAGLAVSQAGDWLYNVALLAFVYERTHSAAWLAATTAARVLPLVLLGPLGGVLADRFDRRTTMVLSDVVRAVLLLALALVALAGLPVVLAPVLAGLATAAAAPYPPSAAATTPRLVPARGPPGRQRRPCRRGHGRCRRRPGLGSVLLLLGPPSTAFLVDAASFVLSALAVLSIPAGAVFRPARGRRRPPRDRGRRAEGARALRAQPVAVRLVGADVVCSVVYGMQTVLLLLLSR